MNIINQFELNAKKFPEAVCLIDSTGSVTYRKLMLRAVSCSVNLSKVGVDFGDRCVVCASNSIATAVLILGIWYRGGIPVLINEKSPQGHLQHAVLITDAPLIVLSISEFEFNGISVTTASLEEITSTSQSIQSEKSEFSYSNVNKTTSHSIASVVFTSGSTGKPKGVTQTHGSLINACRAVFNHLGFQPNDKILSPVPWSFDYGYGQLLTTLLMGVPQVIPHDNNPFAICECIGANKPTILAGVPSLFASICQGISPIDKTDTTSIRLITSTGSKIHNKTLDSMKSQFGSAEYSLNYGLTETYRSASLPAHLFNQNHDSVGFALPGTDIVVLRSDGSVAEHNEIGEVIHRGSGVFLGYWGATDKTQEVRKADPLWPESTLEAPAVVFTGDLGWKDPDGLLYIKGRRDRQIKSMGVRVSPDEIEAILADFESISEAAVISKPHEILGEMVVAVFVPNTKQPVQLNQLKSYCREKLSPYMMPREFHEATSFPRTSSGKIDYPALLTNIYERENTKK